VGSENKIPTAATLRRVTKEENTSSRENRQKHGRAESHTGWAKLYGLLPRALSRRGKKKKTIGEGPSENNLTFSQSRGGGTLGEYNMEVARTVVKRRLSWFKEINKNPERPLRELHNLPSHREEACSM